MAAWTSGRRAHLRDNFVITEDDYIGYLTQSPVESLIPLQILNKVRDSHFLFLGYRMRDWTLRVFLQRIWGEQPLEARSWAVAGPGARCRRARAVGALRGERRRAAPGRVPERAGA